MLTKTRSVLAALALVLASPAGASGCGVGCGAELSVAPVHIEGTGQSLVDLTLTATLTNDGDPVPGADVEFLVLGSNGIVLGSATTGSDGVARLDAPDALGPNSIRGNQASTWTAYAARMALLQHTDEAADSSCAELVAAPFAFVP